MRPRLARCGQLFYMLELAHAQCYCCELSIALYQCAGAMILSSVENLLRYPPLQVLRRGVAVMARREAPERCGCPACDWVRIGIIGPDWVAIACAQPLRRRSQ